MIVENGAGVSARGDGCRLGSMFEGWRAKLQHLCAHAATHLRHGVDSARRRLDVEGAEVGFGECVNSLHERVHGRVHVGGQQIRHVRAVARDIFAAPQQEHSRDARAVRRPQQRVQPPRMRDGSGCDSKRTHVCARRSAGRACGRADVRWAGQCCCCCVCGAARLGRRQRTNARRGQTLKKNACDDTIYCRCILPSRSRVELHVHVRKEARPGKRATCTNLKMVGISHGACQRARGCTQRNGHSSSWNSRPVFRCHRCEDLQHHHRRVGHWHKSCPSQFFCRVARKLFGGREHKTSDKVVR